MYTFDGDQVWDELKQFGTEDDIGNANSLAQKTVIVKVNGNLTIGENGIVEPFHTDYGGPKGFMLYVTGRLINNGNIRNNNGAYAEGQNVYLWKNHDGSYETVPAYGSNGGDAVTASSSNSHINGNIGLAGVERSTAGGGSGAAARGDESGWAKSGAGARGTSYSGGTGGGGVNGNNYSLAITADTGSQLGGQGGNAKTYRPSSWAGRTASGGAGNPGGMGSVNNSLSETGRGPSGTGGLLVVYADNFTNNATIQANGTTGGNNTVAGGSSGGGSVNIFYNTSSTNNGTIEALGGAAAGRAGAGGDGTVTIGSVNTGSYKDRQTVYDVPLS